MLHTNHLVCLTTETKLGCGTGWKSPTYKQRSRYCLLLRHLWVHSHELDDECRQGKVDHKTLTSKKLHILTSFRKKELTSCKSQTHLPYLKSFINYLLKHCFDQVSAMLDRLYCSFDELAEKYSVYKIDTIGDGEQLFVVSARFFDWE